MKTLQNMKKRISIVENFICEEILNDEMFHYVFEESSFRSEKAKKVDSDKASPKS